MASSVEQQLLGYLLGALDDSERETMEADLQHDPQLREQLVGLRVKLEPLRRAQIDFDPPPGLARRTCTHVAAYVATHSEPAVAAVSTAEVTHETSPVAPAAALWSDGSSWSWPDFSVATGVVMAALVLLFPAIQNSRFQAQILTCQDHLKQVGQALIDYSTRHGGYFPQLPQQGTLAAAGIYAPTLLRDGLLHDSRSVLCPGSALASSPQFRVPSFEQLQNAAGTELARLRSMMGGSYGYSLGYVDGGRYCSTRNLSRPTFALLADAPSQTLPGYQSLNHGGRGQNVLFEDGHVAFLPTPRPVDLGDDLFVNDTGMVAPGNHRNDSVIGASDTIPVILVNSGGL